MFSSTVKLLGLTIVLSAPLMAGTAQAATVSGTFNIDIYNYFGGSPDATDANVAAHNPGDKINSITYTGALDFDLGAGSTILDFLNSAGGLLSDTTGLAINMSNGGFTTLLD